MEEQLLKPEEVREILLKLQEGALDIVLVGGQAVNFWAVRYATDDELWTRHRPFTSTDIDFLGSRRDVKVMASLLGGRAIVNEDMDGSPNAGIVLVPHRGGNLRIDVLGSVFGLDSAEVARDALEFVGTQDLAGVRLQVMDPFMALEGKLASLQGLDQSGRQDCKHVKLCLLIIGEFLKESWNVFDDRRLLGITKYIFRLARSSQSLCAWHQYGIKIESCLPWTLIDAHRSEKFDKFRQLNQEQLLEMLTRERDSYSRKETESEARRETLRHKRQTSS